MIRLEDSHREMGHIEVECHEDSKLKSACETAGRAHAAALAYSVGRW